MGPEDEEQDFKALLARTEKTSASSTNTEHMDLDHLTKESPKVSSSKYEKASAGSSFKMAFFLTLERLSRYTSMLCYFYPFLCGTFVFAFIGLVLWGLGSLIFNPSVEYGVMKHDHSFLDSKYNLQVSQIDHWCLRGDNDSCKCEDPLTPTSRADRKSWQLAFKTNRKVVKSLTESKLELDVVFLGESLIEEMDGRWMGQGRAPTLKRLSEQFHKIFSKSQGGKLNAAALGIAGDTAPNVLWRLMHGEMTEELNPKIWWLSLGMNDLARMQCSEEVAVMGILRVVEELLEAKPNAHIVINSLFPMSKIRGSAYPRINDFKDSFEKPNQGRFKGKNRVSKTADPNLQVIRGGTRLLRKKKKGDPQAPKTEEQAADAQDEAMEKRDKRKWYQLGKKRAENNNRVKKSDLVLKEQHKIHKHTSAYKLPIWTSVAVVNRQLRKFCQNHERVTFFDVTNMFTVRGDQGFPVLKTNLISIRGHPTSEGFRLWEEAAATQALQIINDMKRDNPDAFDERLYDANANLQDVIDFDNFPTDDDFMDDAFQNKWDDDFATMDDDTNGDPDGN